MKPKSSLGHAVNSVPFTGSSRGKQRGVALLVVLMLLVIVTLLGIASMRGAIMQERMAANTTARNMSFQVAEAGLRQAEIIVRDGTPTFPSTGCTAGRCKDASWMADAAFWGDDQSPAGYQVGSAVSVGEDMSISPRFIIEEFGTASTSTTGSGSSGPIDMSKAVPDTGPSQSVFRITSYAKAPNGAEVILQSLYRR